MLNIITVFRYGESQDLFRTIESLIQQRHKAFKVWFILSNAKPEDISIIAATVGTEFAYHITENQDTSLYNAMNLALKLIPSGWVFFLNGGDILFSDESVSHLDANKSEKRPVLFSTIQSFGNDKYARLPSPDAPAHQGFLVNLKQVGSEIFDEKLKIAADHYWMRSVIESYGCIVRKIFIAEFRLGGVSNYPSLSSTRMRMASQGFSRAGLEFIKFFLRMGLGDRLYYKFLLGRTQL